MKFNSYQESITMGTWNVRYAPEVFGEVDPDYDWESRRYELAKMVKANRLDILAVQESNEWQLGQIQEVLHLEMVPREHWAECFYPSFFIDTKRVKLLDHGDLWLSKTPVIPNTKLPGSKWPRMLTWVYGEIKNISGTSLLINVHMDGENMKQMEVFDKLIIHLIEEKNPKNIFISGDFNLSLKKFSSEAKGFYKSFFHHSIANTLNAHGKIDIPLDIDWILISKNIQENYEIVFSKKNAKLEKNNSAFYVSDHDLVIAKIKAKSFIPSESIH